MRSARSHSDLVAGNGVCYLLSGAAFLAQYKRAADERTEPVPPSCAFVVVVRQQVRVIEVIPRIPVIMYLN